MTSIIVYILQVTAVFSIFYTLYLLIFSKLTFYKLNRLILLGLIPISLILPYSGSVFPSLSSEILNSESFDIESFNITPYVVDIVNTSESDLQEVSDASATPFNMPFIQMLVGLYMLVLSVILIRISNTIRRLFKLINGSQIQKEKDVLLVLANVREVFSFFKWIVIPKHSYTDLNPKILEHEKAHITLRHSWDVLISECFIAVFWFNPLVYLYRKSITSVHEYQADDMVLQNGVKTSQYMQLLMQCIEVKKPINLLHYFYQPLLKKRVTMMTKPKSKPLFKFAYMLFIPVFALFLSAFSKPLNQQVLVPEILDVLEPNNSAPSLFPIQHVTKDDVFAFFGEKNKHPKNNQAAVHGGIDIRSSKGTPVLATADGIIKKAALENGWGNLVIIEHSNGYETWYAHLDKFNIIQQQHVEKGRVIGYVGNTGRSSTPHLHYEVRKHGKRLNPLDFIDSVKKLIVLDVGHGGKDMGVDLGSLNEKAIVLQIAEQIKALNKNSNVQIVLTRDSDKFVSLNERIDYINALKPDLVMSLHINAIKNKNKKGTEIFFSQNNKQKASSETLALNILKSFGERHTELKHANFKILDQVEYPIALIELGFLSNVEDRAFLSSENGQLKIAKALLEVIN